MFELGFPGDKFYLLFFFSCHINHSYVGKSGNSKKQQIIYLIRLLPEDVQLVLKKSKIVILEMPTVIVIQSNSTYLNPPDTNCIRDAMITIHHSRHTSVSGLRFQSSLKSISCEEKKKLQHTDEAS